MQPNLKDLEARRAAAERELAELENLYRNSLKSELDELSQKQEIIAYKAAVAAMNDAVQAVNRMRQDAIVKQFIDLSTKLEGRASKGVRNSNGQKQIHEHNVTVREGDVAYRNGVIYVTATRIDNPSIRHTLSIPLSEYRKHGRPSSFCIEVLKSVEGAIFDRTSQGQTVQKVIRKYLKDNGLITE